MSDQNTPTPDVIKHAIVGARDMMIYCNEMMENCDEEDENF